MESGKPHVVLFPVAFNDGDDVPEEVFDQLVTEAIVKFGGFTWLPPTIGGWADAKGKYQPDKHRPIFVIVPYGKEEEFIDWVKHAGRELRQEIMLVMHSFCEASFIDVEAESWGA